MTFSVALFITGVGLILLGLLGKVHIHEIKAGTDHRLIRIIVAILGVVCVFGGLRKEGMLGSLVSDSDSKVPAVDEAEIPPVIPTIQSLDPVAVPQTVPALEPASLPNLSGMWYAQTITESSNLEQYVGLELN